ncbi:MAG TPA: hypothetical protein VLH56_11855 [Dissulfurispiraceae bacterium]|nr:hypothetical protein [Dissulfurispiraceae bacterium]
MKTFLDMHGRIWTISLTIEAAKRVRALLNVDLLAPEAGEPPLLTRLGIDAILLCDVIFALVKPQADKAGISDIEFGESLGGESVLQARQAFNEEYVSFFKALGRADLEQMILAQMQLMEMAVRAAEAKMKNLNLPEVLASIDGASSMSSPVSSELTQGR